MADRMKESIAAQTVDDLTFLLGVVQQHPDAHLASEDLYELCITLSDLAWEPENTIDFEARFCNPYPAAEFDELFEERCKVNNGWCFTPDWISDPEDPPTTAVEEARQLVLYLNLWIGQPDFAEYGDLAGHGDWARGSTGDLYEHPEDSRVYKDWRIESIYRAIPWPQAPWPTDPAESQALYEEIGMLSKGEMLIARNEKLRRPGSKPLIHMACSLIEDRTPDDRLLLRSEVLCAISLMRDHVKRERNWDYAVHPVFVYSFAGRSVRVLQFHWDAVEQMLRVRKTSYMHIASEHEMDKIKLILRWMMNKLLGELKINDLRPGYTGEDANETCDRPPTPRKSSVR